MNLPDRLDHSENGAELSISSKDGGHQRLIPDLLDSTFPALVRCLLSQFSSLFCDRVHRLGTAFQRTTVSCSNPPCLSGP